MQDKLIGSVGLAAMAVIVGLGTLFNGDAGPVILNIRAEFLLFGLSLVGVAVLHGRALEAALSGLVAVVILKWLTVDEFALGRHLWHEAPILVNLLGLLLGFAVLARHFEQSEVPELLPKFLPDDWKGGFVLLVLVFVMSAFLDNIAAAMIGGTIAAHVFKQKLDIGFIAAIVAVSNAGGAGSVVGDTTTTMMWIAGIPAFEVLHAYIAAVPALLFVGVMAARQQHALQPIQADIEGDHRVQTNRLIAVLLILVGAVAANVVLDFPAVGVWIAIALSAMFTRTDWKVVPAAVKGAVFLLSLVATASMMPVDTLPDASWPSAFVLGFVSSVFDNIPLTKLALDQGGYDWGVLAYAVGYGGSMVWFGSSAGVAISNIFPGAKSVGSWMRRGWFVTAGYVIGFAVLMWLWGWQPAPSPTQKAQEAEQAEVPIEVPTEVPIEAGAH